MKSSSLPRVRTIVMFLVLDEYLPPLPCLKIMEITMDIRVLLLFQKIKESKRFKYIFEINDFLYISELAQVMPRV